MDKVIVLLPALNEVESIGKVIREVRRRGQPNWEIIVADSGSRDGTIRVAEELGAVVIHGPRGKGSNVKNAFGVISKQNEAAYLFMLDSDYTYPAEYINPMLTILQTNKHDVIIGKRENIAKNAMSVSHRFGNTFLTVLANALYPTSISDLCTGFWGFNKKALLMLEKELTAPRFQLEADIFSIIDRYKLRLAEMPIYYRARQGSIPHLKVKDGFEIAWWLIKRRF